MSESQYPGHEKAVIPADQAVQFMVNEWAQLGFDVSASAMAMIEALIPHVAPGDLVKLSNDLGHLEISSKPEVEQVAEALKRADAQIADASHALSGLALDNSVRKPLESLKPAMTSRKPCSLCGGTGCRACN